MSAFREYGGAAARTFGSVRLSRGRELYIPREEDGTVITSAFAARNRPVDVAPSDLIYEIPS